MKYYSEETVKKIMQEVEVKETQCNVYDNLYSVQRIYPNLDNFESIDIAEPHGRLIDADKIELGYDPHFGGRIIATSDAIANTPTILKANYEED